MRCSSPLVLSRRTVAIISLFAALPLVALQSIYLLDPQYWIGAFIYGGLLIPVMFVLSVGCLIYLVVELIFRRIKFIGFLRLPWFSPFLMLMFVLCFWRSTAIALLMQSVEDSFRIGGNIWMLFVIAVFQVIGQLSLVQPVEDETCLMVTDTGRRAS